MPTQTWSCFRIKDEVLINWTLKTCAGGNHVPSSRKNCQEIQSRRYFNSMFNDAEIGILHGSVSDVCIWAKCVSMITFWMYFQEYLKEERGERKREERERRKIERILFEDNIISLYMSLFAFIILTFDLVNVGQGLNNNLSE